MRNYFCHKDLYMDSRKLAFKKGGVYEGDYGTYGGKAAIILKSLVEVTHNHIIPSDHEWWKYFSLTHGKAYKNVCRPLVFIKKDLTNKENVL